MFSQKNPLFTTLFMGKGLMHLINDHIAGISDYITFRIKETTLLQIPHT